LWQTNEVRIFTRYILGEVVSHALIGIAVFTFVIFMRDMARIMELVVRNSAPLPAVLKIFLFTIPTALTVTLPMGVLVGILIGLSRLAADSEVTAMRASGLGAGIFLRVVAVFGIAAWLFAVCNSLWFSPGAARRLARLQEELSRSQVSFEVQPRVFYENFPGYVFYVRDVLSAPGAALWQHIFIADVNTPAAPRVILAEKGVSVAGEQPNTLILHLENAVRHELAPKAEKTERDPDPAKEYDVNTFQKTDFALSLGGGDPKEKRQFPPTPQLKMRELTSLAQHPSPEIALWYGVELQRRLALPSACLVLVLVGIPLGLSSRRGGKSTAFVLTIVLVFVYYLLTLGGVSLARSGRLSPVVGVWMANAVFLIGGAVLLWRVDRTSFELPFRGFFVRARRTQPGAALIRSADAFGRSAMRRRLFSARFPLIIDDYILKGFALYVSLILGGFLVLTLVFTFFELLGDILRNGTPLLVAEYLLHVVPWMLYLLMPLTVLLGVLVTFGVLQRSNEITAMKATGVSVYRIIVPVLVIAGALAGALFFFDQLYLPQSNKRREALRNRIEGRPAQTYLRPDRKWIFGQKNTIYYYQFYDPDRNRFGSFTAFQFDPETFQITKRIHAAQVHWEPDIDTWVFEQGWVRTFRGAAIENYSTFKVTSFDEVTEPPQYFKKELKQSEEMNYEELRRYINDLQQSGFDVSRLRVQLHKKFAYPMITLVMAVLAVPFSLTAGRRGPLAGVAVAVGVAVFYWVLSGLFEAMGNVNQLPPALAAWSPDVIFGLLGGYLILKVPT
jgi:LPS export ABC transporter permease LptG/LPS export ABC transporter permease LptF